MTDYIFLMIYLQDLGKILESMKGVPDLVAVLALVIAFYAIMSLKKSDKDKDKEHKETMQVIREAIVVIKDQMVDQKTAVNNIQSSLGLVANLAENNTNELSKLTTVCHSVDKSIAMLLRDRSDV